MASQVRVYTRGHTPFVVLLSTVITTFVPLQASKADGGSKLQIEPQTTVLSGTQVRVGGVVSTTVTAWLQVLVWLQLSVAIQVRVMTCGQAPLVMVLTMEIVTVGSLQVEVAFGGSKSQTEPHVTVLLDEQVMLITSRPFVFSVKVCKP